MGYRWIHREWPSGSLTMYLLLVGELMLTVSLLVLFALAQPDLYRTQLWQAGDQLGFNSSPNIVLFAYAMWKPLPTIPFVWSSTLTNFNVAISVISLFVLITKFIALIMHVWYPICALLFNVALVVLYTVSVYGQMGPDYADPTKPSPIAWYIAKPCTVAANQTIQGYCRMAKGTYGVTIIFLCVYLANLGLNIWAMIPTEKDKKSYADSDDEDASPSLFKRRNKTWEMQSIPPTPRTGTMPFTPRTMAFNTLERKLPLRSQYR